MVQPRNEQIETLATIGPSVSGTNLTTLTDGSNADSLHTHSLGGGGAPSGSAGGDLNGTYPNPGVIGVRGSSVNPQADNTTDIGSSSLRIKNINVVGLIARGDTSDINKTTLTAGSLTSTIALTLSATTAASEAAGKSITISPGIGGVSIGVAAGGIGGALNLTGVTGGAGSGALAGGVGSTITLTGGIGGAGTASALSGAGGSISIMAGNSGATGGFGRGNAGALSLDAGTSTTNGSINIGITNAQAITIGRSTKVVSMPGSLSLDTMAEYTVDHGITVESILIKDTSISTSAENLVVTSSGGTTILSSTGSYAQIVGSTEIYIDAASGHHIYFRISETNVVDITGSAADFLQPIKVNTINEHTSDSGVTIDSALLKDGDFTGVNVVTSGKVNTDTISEYTVTNGISVDGLLIKDSRLDDSKWREHLISIDVTDGGGGAAITEKIAGIPHQICEVVSARFTNITSITGSNSDNATFKVYRRNSSGTQATIATLQTLSGVNLTAWVSNDLGSLTNTTIAANECITVEVTKAGGGAPVNITGTFTIVVTYT